MIYTILEIWLCVIIVMALAIIVTLLLDVMDWGTTMNENERKD